MDPNVEKIFKLPTKQKILILVFISIIEAAALVWFLYLPKHTELDGLKAELTKLEGEISEKTRIARLPMRNVGKEDPKNAMTRNVRSAIDSE